MHRISLKWFLFISLVILSVLPILILSNWMQYKSLERETRETQQDHLWFAKIIRNSITNEIADSVTELRELIKENDPAQTELESTTEHNKINWFGRIALDEIDNRYVYPVTSLYGDVSHAPELSEGWLPELVSRARALPDHIIFSDLHANRAGEQAIYLFYVESSTASHAYIGSINIENIAIHIAEISEIHEEHRIHFNSHMFLIDHSYGVISHSLRGDTHGDDTYKLITSDRVKAMITDRENSIDFFSEDFHENIAITYTPILIPQSSWGILIIHFAESPGLLADSETEVTIWVLTASIVLISLLLSVFITRVIMQPVGYLSELATAVTPIDSKSLTTFYKGIEGEKNTTYFTELSSMITVFKNLVCELAVYQEDMEYKVAQRYKVLENENEERLRTEKQQRHLAVCDTLTGLPNKYLLLDRIQTAINGNLRTDRETALILISVVGLDKIHKEYGHIAGDAMIRNLAKKLRKIVRLGDTLARCNTYQFALLITDSKDSGKVNVVADRLRSIVNDPKSYVEETVSEIPALSLFSSLGIAVVTDSSTTPEQLIDAAAKSAQWDESQTYKEYS